MLANADELDLTQNQKNQATDKKRQANETVDSRLLGAYHWALAPEAPDLPVPRGPLEDWDLEPMLEEALGVDGASRAMSQFADMLADQQQAWSLARVDLAD